MGGAKGAQKGKSQGHTLPRERLTAEKFGGTVLAWKGKYGWIQPSEEVAHEKASLHNGALFASKDDLVGIEALEIGAPVEFHIWEDESGLGADEIEQTGEGTPAPAGAAKGGWQGGAKGAGAKGFAAKGAGAKGFGVKGAGMKGPAAWGADDWGGAASAKGWGMAKGMAKGGAKGWALTEERPVMSNFTKTSDAKGFGKGKEGKEGKNGKSKMGGKGHLLPRTRISEEKFAGTVAGWKGKYGWIVPSEEISHEKSGKNGGKLFVSKDDLVEVEELTEGSTVMFHIWEDSSGLGAEEVEVA